MGPRQHLGGAVSGRWAVSSAAASKWTLEPGGGGAQHPAKFPAVAMDSAALEAGLPVGDALAAGPQSAAASSSLASDPESGGPVAPPAWTDAARPHGSPRKLAQGLMGSGHAVVAAEGSRVPGVQGGGRCGAGTDPKA